MDRYVVLYPERRTVSGKTLISWARDDVANGLSCTFEKPDDVTTVADALSVFEESGSVTAQAHKVNE